MLIKSIITVLAVLFILASKCYAQQKDLFDHQTIIEKKQKNYNKLERGWNFDLDAELTVT